MKPHPRIRKTIKWGGAAVTVLLVVVWVGSGWMWIEWRSGSGMRLLVTSGTFRLGRSPLWAASWHADFKDGSYMGPKESRIAFGWRDPWRAPRTVYFPLWIPCLAAAALSGAAWRLDIVARRRDARLSLCAKCGYDRTGILKDAKCPECGSGGTPA